MREVYARLVQGVPAQLPESTRGEVYARLVQGVPAGSTHGRGVREARPGGPGTTTRADTWGSCTPGSSRGSRYTYQGANVGEVYAWRVQGSK